MSDEKCRICGYKPCLKGMALDHKYCCHGHPAAQPVASEPTFCETNQDWCDKCDKPICIHTSWGNCFSDVWCACRPHPGTTPRPASRADEVRDEIDTEWTDYPVCPRCGFSDQDWWDGLEGNKNDGDQWEATCGQCDKAYTVTMCVSVSFSTGIVAGDGEGGGE